ncbi:MAG: cupredoxin domain-containing protein [Acidimicrobiales bacterium]
MTNKRLTPIGALAITGAALTGAALTGCGGDDDGAGGDGLSTGSGDEGGSGTVTVVAHDSLSFDRDDYTAGAGEVTFDYENGGNLTHTLLIDGVNDFKLSVTSSGDTDEGSAELEPGDYRIFCDVPGHESMEATLTVE